MISDGSFWPAHSDGTIKAIADSSTVRIENQLIDGVNYDTQYLVPEHYVARIGDTQYTKLNTAINDVESGEIIDLIDDNYLFYTLNIDADKDFTINTNGYKIYQGNPITNNGSVSIVNNSTQSDTIFYYYGSGYAITNNAGAALSLTKLTMETQNGINNNGTLSLERSYIAASKIAINNSGTTTAQNEIVLTGTNYPLYNNGGTINISDANITNGQLYNNSGTLSLASSSVSKSGENIQTFVTNNDVMRLDSTEIILTNTQLNINGRNNYMRTLYNKGSLITSNSASIKHVLDMANDYAYEHVSAVYNDGGTILAEDTNFIADGHRSLYDGNQTHGIYNPSGNVTMESGTIQALGAAHTYGILNGSGSITLGTPESPTSQNYGRDTADVSTVTPSIVAITSRTSGTPAGIGIKNNSGKVFFYDGKIAGSTAALSEEPTGTEYLYEVCAELDTSTTPNLYTAKLFWMRDGQSTCANN